MRRQSAVAVLLFMLSIAPGAQVTYDRLRNAGGEPQNWLTYSGSYNGRRYSLLRQIDLTNVRNLEQKWIFQAQSLQNFEATPLVVDGVMYLTQPPNDVVALDARSGRIFWTYRYSNSPDAHPSNGFVNRGLAILDHTLFMATVDAHLIALDSRSGRPLWKTKVADVKDNYTMTLAPLAFKDKVLVGTSGGDMGIRGFIAAYDARTGAEWWRFFTIPAPGEPGHETWEGDAWRHGGGSVWVTGSYDPELNLTYWGIGNPGPDWNPDQRKGDNLYSNSVVALDADTGKLRWHFQFTPHDAYDYDSVQIPVLVDGEWSGRPRRLLYWANRNGFFYVLDRASGEFLFGSPFVRLNWASGLDRNGRPIPTPQSSGEPTYPGPSGATNWYSPSYSPRTGLFYLSVWEDYGSVFKKDHAEYKQGQLFLGGSLANTGGGEGVPVVQQSATLVTNGHGAVIALDPLTGQKKWSFPTTDVNVSGIVTTASDLLFVGSREGYFHALNARTGALLWKVHIGGQTLAAPVTYEASGKQYVAIAGGHALFVFALRDR